MSRARKGAFAVLAACTISHFLNHIYTGALSPFIPYIQSELSLNFTQIGVITSAAVLSMTSAHLLVGYMGDKGWRDSFITASILGSAISMMLTSYAPTFLILAILQAALGLGASGYHPSAFPALSERFPQRERVRTIGTQAIGGLIGMAIIPFLGVTLYEILGGWRPSLFLLGVVGLALVIPVGMLMRYGRIDQGRPQMGVDSEEANCGRPETIFQVEYAGQDGWTRNYWLSLVLMGLRGMAFRSTSLLMPVYLVTAYTVEPVSAGYLTTVMLGAGLAAEIVAAPLSDRLNRRVPFLVVSTGVATPALLLLNYSLDGLQLILALVAVGFFFFLGAPTHDAYQTDVCPRGKEGLAFGLVFSIGSLPGAVSPIIFGALGDMFPDLSMSILFLATTMALSTLVALLLKDLELEKKEAIPRCADTTPHD